MKNPSMNRTMLKFIKKLELTRRFLNRFNNGDKIIMRIIFWNRDLFLHELVIFKNMV